MRGVHIFVLYCIVFEADDVHITQGDSIQTFAVERYFHQIESVIKRARQMVNRLMFVAVRCPFVKTYEDITLTYVHDKNSSHFNFHFFGALACIPVTVCCIFTESCSFLLSSLADYFVI